MHCTVPVDVSGANGAEILCPGFTPELCCIRPELQSAIPIFPPDILIVDWSKVAEGASGGLGGHFKGSEASGGLLLRQHCSKVKTFTADEVRVPCVLCVRCVGGLTNAIVCDRLHRRLLTSVCAWSRCCR